MENIKDWDNLLKTLVIYGQEFLRYQEAYYSYVDEELKLSWKTGEDSGGNCWGGTAQYTPCNQAQPEFTILDELLFKIDPDIKLRDFRKITSHITTEDTSSREYYGNGSYYRQLVLDINDLNKLLIESGYVLKSSDLVAINKHFEEKVYIQIENNSSTNKNKKGW